MVVTSKDNKKISSDLSEAYFDFKSGLSKRAFFKVGDHMLGQDLVQETFLKTWRYLVKGGKIHIMKAFLYHILNDLIVDEYRKNKPVSLDKLIKKGFDVGVDDVPKLIDKLDGKRALLLIKKIPLKYRKIMLMRYAEDLTLKEISEINGQSKNTNAVQLHRGKEMIRILNNKK
jgi:RNA polymerase sigma-70 factor (ECF subfamily)